MSMLPLLIHSDTVPPTARRALKNAFEASPERREEALFDAARALHAETGLDCREVRELVGLPERGGCD